MKKYLLILMISVSLFVLPLTVRAGVKKVDGVGHETKNFEETLADDEITKSFSNYSENDKQATIYLFRGKGCGYCHAFLEFLNSIGQEYGKYFKLVSFEVWYDESNWNLFNKISLFKDGELAQGVPYVIIGDQVFGGYAEDYNEDIKKAIKSLYDTPKADRYDIFDEAEKKGLISDEELEALYAEMEEAEGEGSGTTYNNGGSVNELRIIILTLTFVLVGTAAVIIVLVFKFDELKKEVRKLAVAGPKVKELEEKKPAEKKTTKRK